jgi:hypothetical protein
MKKPALWTSASMVVLFLLSGCRPPLSMVKTERLTKLAEMSKGNCYGRCPVYLLTIYDNGVMTYEGARYTDKMGLHIKRLSKPEIESLSWTFQRANLWQYENVYRSDYPDLPPVSITYYDGDRSKTILGKETRPEAVLELEGRLNELANSEGWTLRRAPDYNLPPGTVANQLVVELRSDVNTEAWVAKYSRQEMKLLKKVWPSETKLLLQYNIKVIDPISMLDMVRQDTDVETAELNRK